MEGIKSLNLDKVIIEFINSNFSSIAANGIVSIAISTIVLYFFILFQSNKVKKYKIEHFNNLKRYIDSITPLIHNNPKAYLIEEGFFCYSGKRLNVHEIAFLLSLENNALTFIEQYSKVKMYLEIKNSRLSFKNFYRNGIFRRIMKALNYFGYLLFFGFAMFLISVLFEERFELISTEVIVMMFSSALLGLLMLFKAIAIGTAEKLFDSY